MKFTYLVYGLIVESELPIPELLEIEGPADVIIRLEKLSIPSSNIIAEGNDFFVTKQGIFLFSKNQAILLVRDGSEIIIDPAQGVDERVLELMILGPALALILHQRGSLALHAATVGLDGRAVAFVGETGAGKSALAAALYLRGYKILSDDIAAIHFQENGDPLVFPGFPLLKLWPEVISFLGDDPDRFSCIEPGIEKRTFPITPSFLREPLPLRRVYLLNEDRNIEIVPLKPQMALLELIRHSYRSFMLKWVGIRRNFLQCSSLVNNMPISRLSRPLSLFSLPEVVRIVERDLAQS